MITVKVYGTMRLRAGIKTLELEVADLAGATVAACISRVVQEARSIDLQQHITEKDFKNCLVMVNEIQIRKFSTNITDGDVISFFSPSGGG